MLKLADLAARGDFDAGPLHVSPARRLVEGPAGSTNVEPIVMKVFLLLLDAAGEVVTRDELFGNAWGGVFVGDDSLNRAIARVRKIGSETAPGLFEIETIPRTGYRLTGAIVEKLEPSGRSSEVGHRKVSRRTLIGVGAASAAVLASGGWWLKRTGEERRFDDFLKRGVDGLDYGEGGSEPVKDLQQAVALRPNNPTANGLLAFAIMGSTDNVYKLQTGVSVEEAKRAADIALRADPQEANARLALVQLERTTLDLAGTEDRLSAVLSKAPTDIYAMRLLWNMLQSAGRSRDALALVERAISVKPLAAGSNFPLAQLLWINGRVGEADRVIDRAMNFWPAHAYVRFARFTIFAFTGRAQAALTMLNDPAKRPPIFSPRAVDLWRKSLPVMDQPSPAKVASVRAAFLDAVRRDPNSASQAVLVLSALGEVDTALEIANKLLLFREPASFSTDAGSSRSSSTAWRFTPWLFTPPVASLRSDARFLELCDGTGLTDYWRKRGVRPDYQLASN